MPLKGLHKALPGIPIHGGILEEMFAGYPTVHKAGRGGEFYIHLDTLSGMAHLFVGFRGILGVREMDSQDALFLRKRYDPGMGIATLNGLNLENDKAGVVVGACAYRKWV